jgi:hypothetical protein
MAGKLIGRLTKSLVREYSSVSEKGWLNFYRIMHELAGL